MTIYKAYISKQSEWQEANTKQEQTQMYGDDVGMDGDQENLDYSINDQMMGSDNNDMVT